MAGRAKIALIVTLVLLAVISIVVFALTITMFVRLQNNNANTTPRPIPTDSGAPATSGGMTTTGGGTGASTTGGPTTSGPGPTTTGPTTSGPITSGPTTTGGTIPTTTAGGSTSTTTTTTTSGPFTTGTSSASSTTTTTTSTAPFSTVTMGPTTHAPSSYSFTSCQLTDERMPWKQAYADPWSADFTALSRTYVTYIQNALYNSGKANTYDNAELTVTGFSGQYIDVVNRTGTRVKFVIGVDVTTGVSSFDVGTDLEAGSRRLGYSWRSISATNSSSLAPLPEADQSPGWKSAANMFLTSINASVDPCQNFYNYACDSYIASHPLGTLARQSTFDVLQNQAYANLTEVLENFNASQVNSEILKVIGKMYKACMKVNNETYQIPDLVTAIADEFGGWPLMDPKWTPSRLPNHDLYFTIGDMFTRYGISSLFSPQVDINWVNITANQMLFLDQANLAIPAAYYRSPNLTQRYQDVLRTTIYQTLQILSPQIDNKTVLPQIDEMVKIEVHLAMIMVNSSQMRNMSLQFNPYTVLEANKQFPAINWATLINGSLYSVFPGQDPVKLVEPFNIVEPRYTQSLNDYLTEVNSDPEKLKTLVNYLIFRLVSPFMQFAGPESASIMMELHRQTRMEEVDMNDQQKQCVANLVQMMPWGAGRLYIDGYFPFLNRDDVSVMINNVLSAFSSTLSGLKWMDNVSALKAFNKVAGLLRNVAYPDFQQDDKALDRFYEWMIENAKSIDPKEPFEYYMYFMYGTQLQGQLMWRNVKLPGDRYEFLMSPAVVNAWYQPERNSITFPAAILNEPFYRYDFPQAVNYGALGVVMGHELSHGFDDQGVQYDFDGTLRTWMTMQAQGGFDKMAQCVVDEYSSFCYPQACINGIATQGENIGDNGGLKAAYRAYQSYKAAHGDEKPLPGMETFSTDQIFFLAFAQTWCGSYSEDALTRQLLTNEHSPGKDRVIGAVTNFPKFGEAFKCKLGDPMTPVSHCDVW